MKGDLSNGVGRPAGFLFAPSPVQEDAAVALGCAAAAPPAARRLAGLRDEHSDGVTRLPV